MERKFRLAPCTTARLLKIIDENVIFPLVFLARLFRAQVVIDLGAAPLDGEADWYTLTSHEESLQILVSRCFTFPFCDVSMLYFSLLRRL